MEQRHHRQGGRPSVRQIALAWASIGLSLCSLRAHAQATAQGFQILGFQGANPVRPGLSHGTAFEKAQHLFQVNGEGTGHTPMPLFVLPARGGLLLGALAARAMGQGHLPWQLL